MINMINIVLRERRSPLISGQVPLLICSVFIMNYAGNKEITFQLLAGLDSVMFTLMEIWDTYID